MKTYSQGSIRKHRKYNGSWEWQGFICVTDEDGKHRHFIPSKNKDTMELMSGLLSGQG